ncbi:MAG: hypothetical protein U0793_12825 [Gemmataceae bacterium]
MTNAAFIGRSSGRARPALAAFAAALFLGMAGCSNTGSIKSNGDPLLGDPPNPKAPGGVPAAPTGFFKPATPPRDGSTPAALVGHTEVPSLSGAKPLTLDPGWKRDYGDKTSGPTVVPVPREKSATTPGLLTTGGWTASDAKVTPVGGDPLTRLTALGAVGLRQEPSADGIHLSCFVPGGSAPGSLILLETTAPTLPLAVEAIIQKIGR